ncbi:hypothetical protein [Sphingomonas sp. LHG3406-1]|uniref:hypothetical protein n=1 Tax=Sphingomonas sp. LHG3406-1 TaxID=2804617 RepID=UPI0026210C01|nr:hypothetical protein [Sphingomonas sp. LHG3406-1]
MQRFKTAALHEVQQKPGRVRPADRSLARPSKLCAIGDGAFHRRGKIAEARDAAIAATAG